MAACAMRSKSGLTPPNMSGSPDSGVVRMPSLVIPHFANARRAEGNTAKMPIDPVIVEGSAKMVSAGVDTQ
jgi:hypothetical protein